MALMQIFISALGEGRLKVSAEGPGGDASIESELPFATGVNRRATLLKALESLITAHGFRPDDFEADEKDWMVKVGWLTEGSNAQLVYRPEMPALIGKALYRALFPEGSGLRDLLIQAIQEAKRNFTQLHIRIKVEADSARRAGISEYPWELLHDGIGFLAQRQVTFSRYIAYGSIRPSIPLVERVNVLLVSSNAADVENGFQPLGRGEFKEILEGLKLAIEQDRIKVVEAPDGTFAGLRTFLTEHRRDFRPQVIHFDGHGAFGKRCGNRLSDGSSCRTFHSISTIKNCKRCNGQLPDEPQGYLLFDDGNGQADYRSANEFGTLLHIASLTDGSTDESRVALVVLTACRSGLALRGSSVFNGVAQRLVDAQVPAVVAMQFTITVGGARAFTENLYRALGQRDSLVLAVSRGREAMGPEGDEWYRPVVYLRWEDNEGGQLFSPWHPSRASDRGSGSPVPQPVPREHRAKVAELLENLDVPDERLRQLCRRCLPNGTVLPDECRETGALMCLLDWLAGFGRQSDGTVPILEFVESLRTHHVPSDPRLRRALRAWLRTLAEHFQVTPPRQNLPARETPIRPQNAYLLVELDSDETPRSGPGVGGTYRVQAWVWGKDGPRQVHAVDEPIALDHMSQVMKQIFLDIEEELLDARDNLTIGVLLPSNRLNYAVEGWKVPLPQPEPIGDRYLVVVRCRERIRNRLTWPSWRQHWDQIKQVLNGMAARRNIVWSDQSLASAGYELKERLSDPVVGCLALTTPQSGAISIMLQRGIPIGIWPRGRTRNDGETRKLLEELIHQRPLRDLPARVRQRRVAGDSITLLWDDPEFVPPEIMLKAPSRHDGV